MSFFTVCVCVCVCKYTPHEYIHHTQRHSEVFFFFPHLRLQGGSLSLLPHCSRTAIIITPYFFVNNLTKKHNTSRQKIRRERNARPQTQRERTERQVSAGAPVGIICAVRLEGRCHRRRNDEGVWLALSGEIAAGVNAVPRTLFQVKDTTTKK